MRVLPKLKITEPRLDARNAINLLRAYGNKGLKQEGFMKKGPERNMTRVKISARTLLELLSGRLSQEEFFKHYSFIPEENPFQQALDRGQLVTSLERSEEEDDDWILFEMKGPDPAIGPFLMPDSSGQKKERTSK